MRRVCFELHGPGQTGLYEAAGHQTVGALIEQIMREHRLPTTRATGEQVVYQLYHCREGRAEALSPERTAGELHGELLLIADPQTTWWQEIGASLAPASGVRPLQEAPVTTQAHCRLILAPGVVVSVPFRGLELSRSYIEERLPPTTRGGIALQRFLGIKGALEWVSRSTHCSIHRVGSLWVVRAQAPTWWERQELARDSQTVISRSGRLGLGRHGWVVQVDLTGHAC